MTRTTTAMDHYHRSLSAQSNDDRTSPEYDRSSRSRYRARERSPVDSYNVTGDGKRSYRARSRQRTLWEPPYHPDPGPRRGRDVQPQTDVTLPKNFPKPLTCFFWFHNGRCSKRDQDCAYAHWNTGHLAGSPITVSASSGVAGSVAGKKARELASDTYRPAEDFEVRAAALKLREENVERRAKSMDDSEAFLERREVELEAREGRIVAHEASTKEDSLIRDGVCSKCGGDIGA